MVFATILTLTHSHWSFGNKTDTGPPASSQASTADHSSFDVLQQTFKSGRELTKACLSCHNLAAKQVHTSTHWNWEFANGKTGQLLGKRNVLNSTLIAIASNGTCSSFAGFRRKVGEIPAAGAGLARKSMNVRSFLDTNILVYTDDSGAPEKREAALDLVESALDQAGAKELLGIAPGLGVFAVIQRPFRAFEVVFGRLEVECCIFCRPGFPRHRDRLARIAHLLRRWRGLTSRQREQHSECQSLQKRMDSSGLHVCSYYSRRSWGVTN